jgi:hypothetical protein
MMIFLLVALFLVPAGAWAQSPATPGTSTGPSQPSPTGTTPGQPVAGVSLEDMKSNVSKMTQIMDQINQMLQQQNLTADQQQDIMNMLGQIGAMMQQTCSPTAVATATQQQKQQLQDMQKRLDNIKSQTTTK